MKGLAALAVAAVLGAAASAVAAEDGGGLTKSHGLTLGDTLRYGPDYRHLDYVNPQAPKGGELRMSAIGSFDTFNPFIVKGEPAAGLPGFVYATLMTDARDDPLAEYGEIAATVEVPKDLSYVIYNLRPEARFDDGTPITAEDVVFSLDLLKSKGEPQYRFYYANIAGARALGPHKVRFDFTGPPNRELPQITGQLPILPKAYWERHDFQRASLDKPLGSGPYRVADFEPGRFVVYERVKDWWGADLPINQGRYNFARVRIDYFRDSTVALEAFKAYQYDYRVENSAKVWATGYDFPAKRDGLVKTVAVPHSRPTGMQAFAFNLRREQFRDAVLRRAIDYAFDFEWANKHLFYGQYTRTKSYFSNSELAARQPPTPAEIALLEPFRGQVPEQVFTTVWEPPKTDGSGDNRRNLRTAAQLLKKAGYKIVDNRLISPLTGRPVEIEFLLDQPAFERVINPFIRNLRRLGIAGRIRTVDTAQYINRVRGFDFDVTVASFPQSDSPGNEQRDYWSSAAAERPGSRNIIGIRNPVVDALIEKIVAARSRAALIPAVRALDRVLLWNDYVVPQFHISFDRLAYWDKFGRPEHTPAYGADIMSWWVDPEKEKALAAQESPD